MSEIRLYEADGTEHRFKVRPWTYGQKQAAMKKVMSVISVGNPVSTRVEIDSLALGNEMVVACVQEWDLKDEHGNKLPITVESLAKVRPAELIDSLIGRINELVTVTPELRKKS